MRNNELNNILKISCNDMCKFATKNCHIDYVDEENGCSWYHSAWAYLRLLDCVSAPQWHESNYRNSIINCFHVHLLFVFVKITLLNLQTMKKNYLSKII